MPQFFTSPFTEHRAPKPAHTMNPCRRLIAVELEIAASSSPSSGGADDEDDDGPESRRDRLTDDAWAIVPSQEAFLRKLLERRAQQAASIFWYTSSPWLNGTEVDNALARIAFHDPQSDVYCAAMVDGCLSDYIRYWGGFLLADNLPWGDACGCQTCIERIRREIEDAQSRWIQRYVQNRIDVRPDPPVRRSPVTDTVRRWHGSIVHDGSLPSTGFEINTAPASGDLFVRQIRDICEALKQEDATVTHRCGGHVHVDCRGLDWYTMRRVLTLYVAVEPALFAMMPPWRRETSYALPCADTYRRILLRTSPAYGVPARDAIHALKTEVQSNLYGLRQAEFMRPGDSRRGNLTRYAQRWQHLKTEKYGASRYNALNFHSWIYRGSLEWRLPPGSLAPTKILGRARTFAALIDAGDRLTDREVARLTTGPTGTPVPPASPWIAPSEILREILPSDLASFVTSETSRHTRASRGDRS